MAGENWRENPPSTFWKDDDTPYTPEEISENFQLGEEYNIYFENYDDWKAKYAETEYGIAGSEASALLGGDDPRTEEIEEGEGLLKTMFDARETRLGERKEEAGTSLAQGIGDTFGQLANQYSDTISQSVGQQTSFTSGASGRQKEKAFSRTQDAMGSAVAKQNLQYTTTSRDLAQAGTELEGQYTYDVGAAERDLSTAEFKKDYKTEQGKKEWDSGVYASLKDLANRKAWDEDDDDPEDEKSCFHPDSTVELEDGSIKTVREVNYGDKVKAVDKNGNIIFSEVWEDLYFNLKDNTQKKYYITIKTGDKTLKVTTMHTVFVENLKKNINAHKVKPGMYINVIDGGEVVQRMVDSVIHSMEVGKYDLYTREGTVVVDGIVVGTLALWPHVWAQWWHKFLNNHPRLYTLCYKYVFSPIFNFYYNSKEEKNLRYGKFIPI